ncbi:hypothetical protein [Thauera sp. 2A1]|uniref:hypothetical protein n=1 Tax=Thauera sp. 2A1 TaxID=2570191 RepID=UPI0012928081|nr:hypothetical protein [Thauera sp. 2A1]KAI5912906.1 hypothetical protein GH664_19860 [Thauera sp. 2A1]
MIFWVDAQLPPGLGRQASKSSNSATREQDLARSSNESVFPGGTHTSPVERQNLRDPPRYFEHVFIVVDEIGCRAKPSTDRISKSVQLAGSMLVEGGCNACGNFAGESPTGEAIGQPDHPEAAATPLDPAADVRRLFLESDGATIAA